MHPRRAGSTQVNAAAVPAAAGAAPAVVPPDIVVADLRAGRAHRNPAAAAAAACPGVALDDVAVDDTGAAVAYVDAPASTVLVVGSLVTADRVVTDLGGASDITDASTVPCAVRPPVAGNEVVPDRRAGISNVDAATMVGAGGLGLGQSVRDREALDHRGRGYRAAGDGEDAAVVVGVDGAVAPLRRRVVPAGTVAVV